MRISSTICPLMYPFVQVILVSTVFILVLNSELDNKYIGPVKTIEGEMSKFGQISL